MFVRKSCFSSSAWRGEAALFDVGESVRSSSSAANRPASHPPERASERCHGCLYWSRSDVKMDISSPKALLNEVDHLCQSHHSPSLGSPSVSQSGSAGCAASLAGFAGCRELSGSRNRADRFG